jgi:hypothetical protein
MKCPVCTFKGKKKELINHIDKKHKSQMPEETEGDPAKFLFLHNHGRVHGYCMICGAHTDWNDKTNLPHKLCDNPACKKAVENSYNVNADRARGIGIRAIHDIEHQRKMQEARTVAVYKFEDGNTMNCLSKDEYKFLSFCERFFGFTSKEILRCPYIFEYDDNGKIRKYDPDFYIIDSNAIVEIKAANNTNPAYIKETGYKVKLKAEAVEKDGRFNYIIVYGNNYNAFIQALYKIKESSESKDYLSKDPKKPKIVIHNESISFLPSKVSTVTSIIQEAPNMYFGVINGKDKKDYFISDAIDCSNIYHLNTEKKSIVPCSIFNFSYTDEDVELYRYTGPLNKVKDLLMCMKNDTIQLSSCPVSFILKEFKNHSVFIDIDDISNNEIGENDFYKISYKVTNDPLKQLNMM